MNPRVHAAVLIALAAALGAGVMLLVRAADRAARAPIVIEPHGPSVAPTAVPDIARFLKTLKLVTVQVETTVDASSDDLSWRGDVRARVRAPVRLSYGCDLSDLGELAIVPRPFSGGVLVRVPEPTLIAAEVFGNSTDAEVRVTGLRLRDVAGEYHLGMARAQINDRARALALTDPQRTTVRDMTARQLESIVRAIRRDAAPVEVEFVQHTSERREASVP